MANESLGYHSAQTRNRHKNEELESAGVQSYNELMGSADNDPEDHPIKGSK